MITIALLVGTMPLVGAQQAFQITTNENARIDQVAKDTLKKALKSYQVVNMNAREMQEAFRRDKKLSVQLPNEQKPIVLEANNMLAPGYYAERTTKEGTEKMAKPTGFQLLKWHDGDNFARFVLTGEGLEGYLHKPGVTWHVRPVKRFKKFSNQPPASEYLLFKEGDVKEKQPFICGVENHKETPKTVQPSGSKESPDNVKTLSGAQVNQLNPGMTVSNEGYILEIATDADYEHYQSMQGGGSVGATNHFIIHHLNEVEGYYESYFDVRFMITYQHVWETPDNYDEGFGAVDPKYQHRKYLSNLEEYWSTYKHHIEKDHVHSFTGKSVSSDGAANNNVCQVSETSYAFTRTTYTCMGCDNAIYTTTHEIGHTFSAIHGDGVNCYTSSRSVMCQGSASNIWFSNDNIGRVSSHLLYHDQCVKCERLTINGSQIDDEFDEYIYNYCQIEITGLGLDIPTPSGSGPISVEFNYLENCNIYQGLNMGNNVELKIK